MATTRSEHEAIQAIADRLQPTLRRQFLAAVVRLRGRLSLEALAKAVERGDLTVELIGPLSAWPRDLRPAVRTMNQAFSAAATRAAGGLAGALRLPSSFRLVDPFALEAADVRSALLVREVAAETRRGIQVAIREAIRTGLPPKVAARAIKPLIGLTARGAEAVMRHQLELLARGVPVRQASVAARRYAEELVGRRALIIARTETVRASIDGQLEAWRIAKAEGLIGEGSRKRWITTPDDRLCPRCLPLHGVEVPLEALFPGGVAGPPLHPQCRCALRVVRTAGARRRAA